MSELSLLHILERQKEKNHLAYQSIFDSLNLSRMERYDQLPETTQSDYQTLRQAGFAPESIVDDLDKSSLKFLLHFGKNEPSRIFLEEDIRKIAQSYGLKFLRTSDFQSTQKEFFLNDLSTFQQEWPLIYQDKYFERQPSSYDYRLLGPSRSFDGYTATSSKQPLLFYHVGKGIYYLVSSYDNWISDMRKMLFLPTKSYKKTVSVFVTLFISLIVGSIIFKSVMIFDIGYLLLLVLYFLTTPLVLLSDWDRPYSFPPWFKKSMYRLIPY